MKFLFKLKVEIFLVVVLILGIVGFFIYGKVMEILTIEDQKAAAAAQVETAESLKNLNETLERIQFELTLSNCLAQANGNESEMLGCQ